MSGLSALQASRLTPDARPETYATAAPCTAVQAHDAVAGRLATAHRTGEAVGVAGPGSQQAGYAVQQSLVDRLTDTAGSPVGYKLGFTNSAVRAEIGVDEPVYGRLLADTVRTPDAETPADQPVTVSGDSFVTPRAEPEIVVRLGKRVEQAGSQDEDTQAVGQNAPGAEGDTQAAEQTTPSVERVAEAVEWVAPAVEIVDSRTGEWELSAATAIADNALAAGLVVGTGRSLDAVGPLRDASARIAANDTTRVGSGSAVMGDPLRAVAWIADAVGGLPAGTLVSTGSLTETVPFDGEVRAEIDPLGTVVARRE